MIEPLRAYQLQDKDILAFAMSPRRYKIYIDYSEVVATLRQKEQEINKELNLIEKINDPNLCNFLLKIKGFLILATDSLRKALGFAIEDTLFVSNLPLYSNPNDLKEIFANFGHVKSVRVPVDRQTGAQKPMALITFKTEADAKSALLKADRFEYKGRKIKVQFANKLGCS